MSITPRELVAGTIEIATLPEVFLRINEMIDSPRHSAADIGNVIMQDPGMTARLLRIVNSAFYGFPSQIDTVSRAITIIGTRELRDLILATTVVKMFKGLPNDLVNMEDFWRHSIYCGLATRTLAAQRGERLLERHFVAGLLHDIGSLLIYRKIPELAREALLRSHNGHIPLQRAEQDLLGFDHAGVGVEIMRKWKLPEHLQEAVEFHHSPTRALHFPRDTALVHLADIIADRMQAGNSGEEHVYPMAHNAWELAGVDEACLSEVVNEVERQFDDAAQMFRQDSAPAVANLH